MEEGHHLQTPAPSSPRLFIRKLPLGPTALNHFRCKNRPPCQRSDPDRVESLVVSYPLELLDKTLIRRSVQPTPSTLQSTPSTLQPQPTPSTLQPTPSTPQPTPSTFSLSANRSQVLPLSASSTAASPGNSSKLIKSCSKRASKVIKSERVKGGAGSNTVASGVSRPLGHDAMTCQVDPSCFIRSSALVNICPPLDSGTPSSQSSTLASFNSPPIFTMNTSFPGALTSPSLPTLTLPTLRGDLDGLSDWFSYEECVQTATRQEAREPLENGGQEQVLGYPQRSPAVPETREDVACTLSPTTPTGGQPVGGANSRDKERQEESGRSGADVSSPPVGGGRRRQGKQEKIGQGTAPLRQTYLGKRKKDQTVPQLPTAPALPKVQFAEGSNDAPVKRKRGRPRKHTICLGELPALAKAVSGTGKKKVRSPVVSGRSFTVSVKKEPVDLDQLTQPQPSVTQTATKKKKVREKSTKATADLITKSFEKPAPPPSTSSQTLVEDSGYSTYVSGSDSGSRSSYIPVSQSPADSITSPALPDYPQPATLVFDESSHNVLIKDPVLLGSGMGESPLDQNEDVTVSVLESGQGYELDSGSLVVPEALGEVTVEGDTAMPSDRELILQLDELLKSEVSPMFTEDMVIGDTQEVTTYEDEEEILNSDTVTGCLKKLQLCGRITGPSHTPSSPDPAHSDAVKKVGKVRRIKKVSRSQSNTPIKKNEKPSSSTPAKGNNSVRILSMVNSRTKSGRVSKPSVRMVEFITKSLDSPSSSDTPRAEGQRHKPAQRENTSALAVGSPTVTPPSTTPPTATPPNVTPPATVFSSDSEPEKPALNHMPIAPTCLTTPQKTIKLKRFELSLTRSPVCQRASGFSFKLPGLSASPLLFNVGVSPARESDSAQYDRIVTIEPTPPPRAVELESHVEPVLEEFADSAPAVIEERATINKRSYASTKFTMSLDLILKEMDEARTPRQVEGASSHDTRVVKIRSHDKAESPPPAGRTVRFAAPTLDSSPADKITNEFLCPLDMDASLDTVLQGDSLFGDSQESDCEEGKEEVGVSPGKGAESILQSSALPGPSTTREVRFKDSCEAPLTTPTFMSDTEMRPACETPPQSLENTPKTLADKFSFRFPDTPSDDVIAEEAESTESMASLGEELPAAAVVMETTTEPVDDDVIALHADDADFFDLDTRDTPLSNLFRRPSSKPPVVSKGGAAGKATPPSAQVKPSVKSRLTLPEPHCARGQSPGYDIPPMSMPYKKQQVSEWVAEQQRRVANIPPHAPPPHKGERPALAPWGLNRNGNSSIEPPYWSGPSLQYDPPLPPPPSTKDSYVGFALEGYCRNFLRGKCDFVNCRFIHAMVTTVPLHIMEAALFQGTPVDLPMEVLCRYSHDLQSCSNLQANQKQLYDLIQGLRDKFFPRVASAYHYLGSSVQFNKLLLVRVLELCSIQSPAFVRALPTAERVYSDLCVQGGVPREAHYFYIKTLANFDVPVKMMETYQVMRAQGELPNYDIVLFLLRLGKTLEHRVFGLLDDLDMCSPPLTDIEIARCANRLLDIADPSLLLKHASKLGVWLDHASPGVLSKLTVETFNKLLMAFTQEKKWAPLMSLLSGCPKHLPSLKASQLCQALNFAVMSLGASEKVADVLGMLSEDQMAGISCEVWNRVVTECAKQARAQKANKFYQVATSHKKQLSISAVSALMTLHLSLGNHSDAVAILKRSLDAGPLSLPPLHLLKALCEVMESPQDIKQVVQAMIVMGTTPTPTILQLLLDAHTRCKAHSTLAEVVTLSLDHNVTLDRLFYQKVLVELRQWGRDQNAISSVYKALRRVENLDPVSEAPSIPTDTESMLLESSPEQLLEDPPDPPPLRAQTSFPSPSLVPVRPGPWAPVSEGRGEKGVVRYDRSLSLENVLAQSSCDSQSDLVKLIEVNGCQGQFGAVASILVTLPNATRHYDNQTVHAIWRAISKSTLKAANAFSNLLTCLFQSRSHIPIQTTPTQTTPTQTTPTQAALLQSDKWLISQIGIALLKLCEVNDDWQSGFVVLHHLHRFGVHYVKLSQPSAYLPPCMPHPPTPCGVALLAINMCLHIDQVSGALEVMQGCDWVAASNAVELNLRTKLLSEMVEKCLESQQSGDAWRCLQAMSSDNVLSKYMHKVTNLHNKLLQAVLADKDTALALEVYRSMRAKKLQCLPICLSSLLESLCTSDQETVAKDLCQSAIRDKCYTELSKESLFQVTLPVGLVGVEVHLLLENHLRKIAEHTPVSKLQPLVVQFGSGSCSCLEQVFSTNFDPQLAVRFSSRGNSLIVPVASLGSWISHHSPAKSKAEEPTTPLVKAPATPPVKAPTTPPVKAPTTPPVKTSATPPVIPMKAQSIKPLLSSALPYSRSFSGPSAVSCDSSKEACAQTALSRDHPTTSSDVTKSPPPTVTAEQRPSEGKEAKSPQKRKRPVRLLLKRTRSRVAMATSEDSSPTPKKAKAEQFKEMVCRAFMDQLKPYYKSGRFSTNDDYLHLWQILSRWYFKECKSRSTYPTNEELSSEVVTIVTKLMSQVQVYSESDDEQLGLTDPRNCLLSMLG